MSRPRQVVAGRTYLITRRVAQRQFLLRPCSLTREVVLYCLARAALKYDVHLHAVQVLSNHVHLVATDPLGQLPDFMAWVDREIAKCLNQHYGRSENFWSDDKYSAVTLIDAQAVFDKLVYVFTNVVTALLVRDFRDWPGLRSTPEDWLDEREHVVRRPQLRFDQHTELHAEVAYCFSVPPQLADREPEQLVADIDNAIIDKQRAIRAQAELDSKHFLGSSRAEKINPLDAPRKGRAKGKLSPRFAAATAQGQRLGRQRHAAFMVAYREAWVRWRRGLHAIFPHGTFALVRLVNVACAPPDTA